VNGSDLKAHFRKPLTKEIHRPRGAILYGDDHRRVGGQSHFRILIKESEWRSLRYICEMSAEKQRHDAFEPIDTPAERRWLLRVLRDETVGGALLLLSGVLAFLIANSGLGDWYQEFRNTKIGFDSIGLNLTVAHWAADAFLAIFFFVAGLELKHEFTHGSLAQRRQAVVPVVAAMAGMVLPALIYVLLVRGESGALNGWAIPVATDIAFALAVLAVAGRGLPLELRAFLLALAVVDDLGAITIIAVFYSDKTDVGYLALTVVLLAAFALMQRLNLTRWYFMVPFALVIWWSTYQSGVHATVAGVAIALLTRLDGKDGESSPASIAEEKVRPISVAIAVPFFAFTAAGVDLRSLGVEAIVEPISLAVIAGLVIGKPLGVLAATYLLTRLTSAKLNENLRWGDLISVGLLAGIGFTVSLLIAELSFIDGSEALVSGKIGILTGSLVSALLAILFLALSKRNRSDR
jgi:NhaA family Na+:H+ antiporter